MAPYPSWLVTIPQQNENDISLGACDSDRIALFQGRCWLHPKYEAIVFI